MSDPYLAGVAWRLANPTDTDQRRADELRGQLAATWYRRGRRTRNRVRALRQRSWSTLAVSVARHLAPRGNRPAEPARSLPGDPAGTGAVTAR